MRHATDNEPTQPGPNDQGNDEVRFSTGLAMGHVRLQCIKERDLIARCAEAPGSPPMVARAP